MTDIIEENIENPDKAEIWLSRDNPHHRITGSIPTFKDMIKHQFYQNENNIEKYVQRNHYKADSAGLLTEVTSKHLQQNHQQIQENVRTLNQNAKSITQSFKKAYTPNKLWKEWLSYSTDSSKRLLQTADVLKERGDIFLEHEQAGCPPVLDYDYTVVMDASEFERPCNYVLLSIIPPKGCVTDEKKRPYIIIDPRAGHGAGIGGFKHESQVGVALSQGHPVYFVAFKRLPEPTQTIADVTYAEGRFAREVAKRHPNSDAPTIIGNCQGGWAALILAATNPNITGPIVLNGAPVSAWSGEVGVNPMRYKAGVNGGAWLSMFSADMNNGVFDGAALVHNFEQMTPYRNYVGKYYDLYKNPQANRQRFLDFERWWGGFFLMNDEEIQWIVENIFIGNRIARNTAQLEKGVNIDLRHVKAPIIAFASHGDDITPPQQALSWILDAYSDERDVEICGQRIIYMIHEQVGHLGIFVSSKIANNEHKGIASIMDMIEVLPPGLYEMQVVSYEGSGEEKTFTVDLKRRTFEDLSQAIGNNRTDEEAFKAVHRYSMSQTQAYEHNMRPLVKAMSNETSAQLLRTIHPLRLQRSIWSSKNPLAIATSNLNKVVSRTINDRKSEKFVPVEKDETKPKPSGAYARVRLPAIESIQQDNLFLQIEKMFMDSTRMTLDFWRDWHGRYTETLFFAIWSMPWFRQYGKAVGSRRLLDKDELHEMPTVDKALAKIYEGDFNEAVVRMLILGNIVADDTIDREQLMRLTEVLTQRAPFKHLTNAELAAKIHTQTIIVRFAEDESIKSLSKLLKTKAKRIEALKLVNYVVGDKLVAQDPTLSSIKKRIEAALNVSDADLK